MFSDLHRAIFKTGSRTYFTSALFFPRAVRDDVSVLYAFVRKADDYVDATPQDKDGFNAFTEQYRLALADKRPTGDKVIDPFVQLAARRGFADKWIEAFLYSMELDTHKKTYQNIGETEEYIYGSAGVVGLMMARILGLPDAALPYAQELGKAMQYINFIRDIAEDQRLGRTYLPLDELAEFGLDSLSRSAAEKNGPRFRAFIEFQLQRYKNWQKKAEVGYQYMPKQYLVPIKSAAGMYAWTAETIRRDPLVVYKRKVRPSRGRIIGRIIYEYIFNH